MTMISLVRIYSYRCYFLFMVLVLIGLFSSTAHADGGAPQLAYVAGGGPGISIIDIAQKRVSRTITLSNNPRTVLLSLDGYSLYVTQPLSGRVEVLEAKTGKTLCTSDLPGQPSLLALSLDATVLYVAGQGDTRVRALNPNTCAIERTFDTHEPVDGLAVAASTAATANPSTPSQLWISGTTSVTVFDTNGSLLDTIPVAGGPQYISIPGGFTAYVTTRQGTLVAIDLNTRHMFQTLLTSGRFGPMDFDAITGEIYVPDEQHNQLDVLQPITAGSTLKQHEPEQIFHLGSSPQTVAITSDGQFSFVALSNGQVVMIDLPGRSIITRIAVGGAPYFIITGLYPPAYNPATVSQQTATAATVSRPTLFYVFLILALLAGVLLLGTLIFFWRYRHKKTSNM